MRHKFVGNGTGHGGTDFLEALQHADDQQQRYALGCDQHAKTQNIQYDGQQQHRLAAVLVTDDAEDITAQDGSQRGGSHHGSQGAGVSGLHFGSEDLDIRCDHGQRHTADGGDQQPLAAVLVSLEDGDAVCQDIGLGLAVAPALEGEPENNDQQGNKRAGQGDVEQWSDRVRISRRTGYVHHVDENPAGHQRTDHAQDTGCERLAYQHALGPVTVGQAVAADGRAALAAETLSHGVQEDAQGRDLPDTGFSQGQIAAGEDQDTEDIDLLRAVAVNDGTDQRCQQAAHDHAEAVDVPELRLGRAQHDDVECQIRQDHLVAQTFQRSPDDSDPPVLHLGFPESRDIEDGI